MRAPSTVLLVLQAEHGGGNNSTFTVRVTPSTGHGHLLVHRRRHRFAERPASRRREYPGDRHVPPLAGEHQATGTSVDEIDTYFTRMLNKEVYNKTGTDLRHRPCCLHDFRPSRAAAEGAGPRPCP